MRTIPRALAGGLLATILLTPAAARDAQEKAAAPAAAKAGAPPNVLLIVIDTLRADHLSAYGYARKTSPNLDRLAAEGVLYESCISAASWTLPAHASLCTGLFPRDHHSTSESWALEDSFDTLAELLKGAGYHTGGFSNNVWTNDDTGLKQGFDTFHEMWRGQSERVKGISHDDPTVDMGAAATNSEVLAWLDGLPGGEPFFVFINYFEPHLPYRPTRPHESDFLPEGADRETVRRLRSFRTPREYGYILRVPWMKVSQQEIEILTDLYDAEIAYTDALLGQLMAGLGSRGLLENTLLVITSDHGEHLGENHMLSHKLSVYDPLLKVPMILWGPKLVPAGVRVRTQVQAHDAFGTILERSGVRRPVPGLPLADRERPYTFAQLDYPRIFLEAIEKKIPGWSTEGFARGLTAVRGTRYKLISGSDGSLELYDLEHDPGETRNLAEQQPAVLETMREALEAFKSGSPDG